MVKENRFRWIGKATLVLLFYLTYILYANGTEVLENKNIKGINRFSSFWGKIGQNKGSKASWLPFYLTIIPGKPCRRDDDCGNGKICVKEASKFNRHFCFDKCNGDYDCKHPMKCKRKGKYCIEYWSACEDNEMFNFQTKQCQSGKGLSGSNCDVDEWCKDNGKYKDCKGVNGTCVYNRRERTIHCECAKGKKLHPEENRCSETCANGRDCEYGGICEEKDGDNFCSCKPGLIGDKCEIVFDCTPKGKYKDCEKSGGKCFFDGTKAICKCSDKQKLNDKKFICESCICRGGKCEIEDGKKVCKCPPGYGNFTNTSCKVCDCGPDTSCIWETKIFGSKICLCKPGYSTKKGKCVACECGPNSNCEWISDGWLKPEKKVCHCKPGFHEENGKCVDKQDLSTFSRIYWTSFNIFLPFLYNFLETTVS